VDQFFRRKQTPPVDGGRRAWGARGTAAATIAARLTFEDVERRYHGSMALRGVSLDVAPGEVLCLLGPSGCGKTTLLRVAAGIEKPSAGRVLINQQEVAGPNRFVPPEARNVGLMFQDFALFPHLTILGNVAFGLRALPKAEARREAKFALARVGLAHMSGEYPHTLSGGEQQRVALARAIAPRPSVLLMDEPFSGLDVQLRDYMQEEALAILRETRATCVIVTHDPDEAMRLADRIAVMRAGLIVQVGEAEELYRTPTDLFVARFFSEINEFGAKVAEGRLETPVIDLPADDYSDGDDVVVCIRQRGVRVLPAGQGCAGRVLDVRFMGDMAVIEIAVQGLEKTVRARVQDGTAPEQGAEISVMIDPASVLVFPNPSEKAP